jgi:hypothetical protein
MLLQYPIFYKNFGVRRAAQLAFPKVNGFDFLHFPRNSLYHYLASSDSSPDPDPSNILFKGYTKRFIVDYVKDLDFTEGNPRHRGLNLITFVRPFLHENKQFRYVKEGYKTNDANALVVMNYSYINKFYIYNKTNMSSYYQWHNIQKTLINKINKIADNSDRNQFLFYDIDTLLPSYSSLKIFSKKTNPAMLKIFNSDSKLFILELWKWLGHDEDRERSILSLLDQKNFKFVNLVLLCQGKWIVVNLDNLDQWRLSSSREKEIGIMAYSPEIIQKLFLRLLFSLVSQSTKLEQDIDLIDRENAEPSKQEVTDTARDDTEELEKEDPTEEIDPEQKYRLLNKANKISDNHKKNQLQNVDVSDSFIDSFDENAIADELKKIDEEIKELDNIEKRVLHDKGIVVDTSGTVVEVVVNKQQKSYEDVHASVYTFTTEENALQNMLEEYADFGIMSASDYRGVKKAIEKSQLLKDPYGSQEKISVAKVIDPKETLISDENSILVHTNALEDQSMAKSTIATYDTVYLNKIMKKDIISAVSAVQKAGVIVEDYSIETDHSIQGEYEYHTLKLRPIDGKPSTVRFKIPVIQEDGSFLNNGNKYIMRKQRTDLPIRKVKPTVVALSSYYGKTFIERSLFQRLSVEEWISKQVNLQSISDDPSRKVLKSYPANVYDNYFKAPYLYNAIATKFKGIVLKNIELDFDHTFREKTFTPETIEQAEYSIQNKSRICGITKTKDPVVMDDTGQIYIYKDKKLEDIGSIFEVLGLPISNSPLDYCSVRVFSKMIPVGFILSYLIGFDNLLTLLKSHHRVIEGNRTGNLDENEWALKFKDKIYIFNRKERMVTLVMSGFLAYKDFVKIYEHEFFNKKEVYFNILDELSLGSIYLKEVDNLKNLFVDPITKEILEQMNEPLTFEGLLVRASEMLLNYNHNDFQDMHSMRIRGYERIAGVIYKELAHSIRQYNSKSIRGKSQVEMNPYAVSKTLAGDPSVKLIEDINPIQNLKEREAVTYVGEGGRNKDTLARDTRSYHESDIGVVSEATVDSGDVGINAYLSANPQFKTIRGVIDPDKKNINNTSLLSTSTLLAPGSDHDDPKRVNFVSIQQSHTIAAQGYHQPYVQTGYELMLAYRTSNLFAYMAEEDGTVIGLDNNAILIEYKTIGKKGVYLGRQYGKAEGSVYPHDIISDLRLGQKIKKGDAVAYNSGFFERDFYDPKRIIYKGSMNVKTALYESSQTLEDSSSISSKISGKMTASTTKIKSYTVEFKQNVRKMVKVGQFVKPDDILFYIEDETTGSSDVFSDETIDVLKRISSLAPKAKMEGTVDRIEVYYHGDKDDMSPTLKQLSNYSDKILKDKCISKGDPVITGQVDQGYSVSGKHLLVDTLEIKIYITRQTKAAIGDKGVFANQMKTVFGEVIDYPMHTQNGEEIDAVFGFRSISARVVLSPLIIGTTTTLLKQIAKKAIDIYEGKSK